MTDTTAFAQAMFHVVLFLAIHAGRTKRGYKQRAQQRKIPLRSNLQHASVIPLDVPKAIQSHKRKEIP